MKKLIVFILLALLLISCVSYKNIYSKLEGEDKKYFYLLLYEVPSKRIKQVLSYKKHKKRYVVNKILKEESRKKGMPLQRYKAKKLEKIRRANMRYGQYEKGIFTDRGRILIKYGYPESKKNKIKKNNEYVIWSYPEYNVDFEFKKLSSGEYKLINTVDELL